MKAKVPDGWRALRLPEEIENGDKFFAIDKWYRCKSSVGIPVKDHIGLRPIIRRIKGKK